MDFSQTVDYDPEYKKDESNETTTYLNKIKCAILNIFSGWFQKNKFDNFWTRNKEIFKIRPIWGSFFNKNKFKI